MKTPARKKISGLLRSDLLKQQLFSGEFVIKIEITAELFRCTAFLIAVQRFFHDLACK
jgi:hypothetical protein